MDALRKHCEAERDAWPEWIPFKLLAYRTKLHTITGFTPFRLFFGREANTFENWSSKTSDDEILLLINRAKEIKTLISETHPEALINIKNKKQWQKEQGFLEKSLAKLNNTQFLSKAPENVINDLREKVAANEKTIQALQQQIKELEQRQKA